jgi:hypothetical protein
MNAKSKVFQILLIAGVLFLIVFLPIYYFKMQQEVSLYHFNGRVDSVSYSVKDEPTIKVNGKEFDLPVNFWDFNHQIEIGDSIVKVKNSMVVEIVKKNGKVIIVK